jgi:hypothetical protein
VLEVLLGGAFGDPEVSGGAVIGVTHRDKSQHFCLAAGETQRLQGPDAEV